MAKFEPKVQIAYVPSHCKGDVNHADVEHGFVTSISPTGSVFCRFWNKPGWKGGEYDLRTKANSEACNPRDLVLYRHVSESLVEAMWRAYVEI